MADAFRGLTLRIGADARPVKSALDSISRSAGQTQKQLNKMSKALKFDGNNTGALKQALALAEDKAQHMAMSLRTVATAMRQAAKESAGFGQHSAHAGETINQAAKSIKNVNAVIQQTREHSKTVNAQLQHIYDSAKRVHAGFIQGKDAAEGMHLAVLGEKEAFQVADKYVKSLQADLASGGEKAKAAAAEIKRLLESMSPQALNNLASKFGLDDAKNKAQELYDVFTKLHGKSGELNSDLKALKNVAGFQALKTEAIAAESALREAVSETVRFKAELASIGSVSGLARAVSEIKGIDAATKAATEQARVMHDTYAAIPRSVEAARNKIIATRNAQQALSEQAKALREAMAKIEHSDGFDKVAASTKNVHLEFERAKSAATEAAVAVEKMEQKVAALNHQKLGEKMTDSDLERMIADIDEAEHELDQLRQKAASADKALESAGVNRHYAELATDLARVNNEMAELKARSSVLNTFQNFGAGLRELGYGLYSTMTPAIMMAGRYAIQAAEDIDSAYRDMRKTVNGTEEEFEHLKQAAMDYSTTHVTSADQILEIEAMGGQLGLAATDLEAFATTISNLDIATNIDADTAAEQLGKMASVLGITSDEYDNFGDSLVRLGNNMPVMESDIMTLMTRFMGMGKVVGMSADEMLGWSAAASATGQKSEAAGSSMQRFISKIETAVTEGGGMLEKFASVAGMSADEFAAAFKENASGAMRAFIAGLGDMQRRGESVNQTLGELKINNVRDKQLLEGLAVQMANATEGASELDYALRLSSEAWRGLSSETRDGGVEKAGDAAREAAKKSEGFSGALQILRNQAQVLGATLAESAAPMLRDLGIMFGDLTDTIKGMPEGMKTSIVGFAAFLAAIGPVSVALGTTLRAITSVVGALTGVGGAVASTAARFATAGASVRAFAMEMSASAGKVTAGSRAMNALGNALGALGSTAGLVGVSSAIALIGGSLAYIIKGVADAQGEIDTFNKATDGLTQSTGRAISVMAEAGGSMEDFGKKANISAYAVDKMPDVISRAAHAQAELVDSMNKRSDAAAAEIGQLKLAQSALDQYMNKTGLTADEQGRLRAAIELLNSAYGTHYSVMDAANGKIADENGALLGAKDSILAFIEAKKQQIQVESLAASYQEAEAQRLERLKELSGQKANIDWLTQQRNQFAQGSEEWNEYNGYIEEAIVYFGKLKQMYDADASSADALAERMGLVAQKADGAKLTVGETAKASAEWGMVIDSFSANMDEFATALDNAGADQEQFSKLGVEEMMKLVSAWQDGGMSMEEALKSVGVSTRSVGDQLREAFKDNAEGLAQVEEMVAGLPMSLDEFAAKLSEAGISARDFAAIGVEQFGTLYTAAEGDFGNLRTLIDSLNAQGIDPKTVQVDGSQVTAADGKVYALEKHVDEVGSSTYTLTLVADAQRAQGDIEGAQESADEWGASEETANINQEGAEEADSEIEDVQGDADRLDATTATVSINADDNASGTINSVRNNLRDLDGDSATVHVRKVEEENASGGIIPAHASGALAYRRVIRAIPRHADGGINGIVTRPTMTNVGLTGEAGAEAIFHLKHAGGAIVPLTNRRYVRPFARTVASEMGGGGRTVNVSLSLNYNADSKARDMARDVVREIRNQMNLGA